MIPLHRLMIKRWGKERWGCRRRAMPPGTSRHAAAVAACLLVLALAAARAVVAEGGGRVARGGQEAGARDGRVRQRRPPAVARPSMRRGWRPRRWCSAVAAAGTRAAAGPPCSVPRSGAHRPSTSLSTIPLSFPYLPPAATAGNRFQHPRVADLPLARAQESSSTRTREPPTPRPRTSASAPRRRRPRLLPPRPGRASPRTRFPRGGLLLNPFDHRD